jgi:hypothetical protein
LLRTHFETSRKLSTDQVIDIDTGFSGEAKRAQLKLANGLTAGLL